MGKKSKKEVEVIGNQEVALESDEKPYFFASISCGYIFRNLVESLLKFSNGASFHFTKEGFFYKYVDVARNYTVVADFPAYCLNSYLFKGGKEFVLSINLDDFHKKIKDLKVQEMIRIFTIPTDQKQKFYFQICENEESEIVSYRFIQSKYIQNIDLEIPILERNPDRVISNEAFTKMGDGLKTNETTCVHLNKKVFENETQLTFEVKTEDESSGAVTEFVNPNMFMHSDDDPHEKSSVIIPKDIFEKFSSGTKFNKDGIVRVYTEDRKYAIFEFSISYISYLRIYVKDVLECK